MRPMLSAVATEADGVFPHATDPLALSLNENPFPPLPAVRSVLVRVDDAVNRYPEFLPERLRGVIASRIGVPAGQVVLGASATGVVLQVLQALTAPGDTMVMVDTDLRRLSHHRADGRLKAVAVLIDKGATTTSTGSPMRPRPLVWWCADRTTPPGPWNRCRTSCGFCGGCRVIPWCCSTRPTSSSPRPIIGSILRR